MGTSIVGQFQIALSAALPTALYLGSFLLSREFCPKTFLFRKSKGSFYNKVERVEQWINGDKFNIEEAIYFHFCTRTNINWAPKAPTPCLEW